MKIQSALIIIVSLSLMFGCTQKIGVQESGKQLAYKEGSITIGKTTKREIVQLYGQATQASAAGKYENLVYRWNKQYQNYDSGSKMGSWALGAIPGVGGLVVSGAQLANTATKDQKAPEIQQEFQFMEISIGLSDGIVRDYIYRDNFLNGEDESAKLEIKASIAQKEEKPKKP